MTKADRAARIKKTGDVRFDCTGTGEFFMISSRIRPLSARIISKAPIRKRNPAKKYFHIT